MDQVLAIQKVTEKIREVIDRKDYENPHKMIDFLNNINNDLQAFLAHGIDYKIVVDALDDSIFITDKDGKCLYVNPAHQRNTEILPEEVLGKNIYDITADGSLFTGGAATDVINTQKKAFRLATVNKTNPPSVGYAVGVPIFDQNGQLYQLVVSSRPILSLQALHEDFGRFLSEASAINKTKKNVMILPNADKSNLDGNKFVGSSYSLSKIMSTVSMAAPTDATVLITGESGVGKEIIADELYRLSSRNDKTFIKVNCASIPANLLESELFGYEKGAFSGANASGKQGLFELANGGTLLLDEIGDMPMDLQVKLLRAIQNQEITRVGGTRPIKLDIRFISATNCNLKDKIAQGTFRQDLFYRLNVIPIIIPPLREHLGDLGELCDHFIKIYTKKHNREFTLSPEHLEIMKQYSWPGNVRELENVIEYLTICASGATEAANEILRGLLDLSGDENEFTVGGSTLSKSLESYEKQLLESVLRDSSSLRDAGRKLGINVSTVSRKIKQYGIEYPKSK